LDDILHYDALIVGGGLTGLRAALELTKREKEVALLSKVHPLRSHSVAAQGGINAALGNNKEAGEDSWQSHAFDTVKGSDYLADQDAVTILCREAPASVLEMEHMGTVFSRDGSGKLAQRPFGGAGFPRTCYASDRTGHNLLHALYERVVESKVQFFEEHFVSSLVVDQGRVVGCIALDLKTGELHCFSSKALLLATGGFGRVYMHSTNAHLNTGEGAGMALRAGAPLKDMEFVQFHPTTLFGTNILISEAARGEGGILLNAREERFMSRYAVKSMELAPRDIVARAIQTEIDQGRGFSGGYVHLDLRHLGEERIKERLPGIRQIALDFAGVDPVNAPIPVQPGQHYSMGGIEVGNDCASRVPGLFAAGECSCVSVHGANRLGGNSLLETLVFGKIAGASMSEAIKGNRKAQDSMSKTKERERKRIERILANKEGSVGPTALRNDLKMVMTEHFGIFREATKMSQGLASLRSLRAELKNVHVKEKNTPFNQSLIMALELQDMMMVAESVALGALMREESRGSHWRTDFPHRDDNRFLRHSLSFLREGELVLDSSPVRLGEFPLQERMY
jgi:succinate dehydrogenase / fumarate reductase, flavoprotein subunit